MNNFLNKRDLINFKYRTRALDLLKIKFFSFIFKKITLKTQKLFFRAGDIISVYPQLSGVHEPELTAFIGALSQHGYKDFLIDIGANIGLTSCQNGVQFDEVHMFEPNPLCCHILEVNAKIALNSKKYFVNNFGLGEENKTTVLTVPKHNWGGAFIKDKGNSYDDSVLAQKDGFELLDHRNYFDIDIVIKNTTDELQSLFLSLSKRGLRNGVIKIDVEGYEPIVLKGIAESLPEDMSTYIVFESWDSKFDINEIVDAFKGRAEIAKLDRYVLNKKGLLGLIDLFYMVLRRDLSTNLKKIDLIQNNCIGDIVIKVN